VSAVGYVDDSFHTAEGVHFGPSTHLTTATIFDSLRGLGSGELSDRTMRIATNTVSGFEHILHHPANYEADDFPLPPQDLVRLLVDAFFDRFNVVACLLCRPFFERQMQADLHLTSTPFRALLFAVLAVASRVVEDSEPRVRGDFGWLPPLPQPASSRRLAL
jgi:hypothetical protein